MVEYMKIGRRATVVLLIFCMTLCFSATGLAEMPNLKNVVDDTAAYLLKTVPEPQVASIGGEWAVIGLARSGIPIPDGYYDSYYAALEHELVSNSGVLHQRKYTEYSRVILALSAIGKDPSNIAGYNLLMNLADYDKVVWQGINGPVFALLALDSKGYEIPSNPDAATQATREMYIQAILSAQMENGGFSLAGDGADPDVTGMALQALAKYRDRPEVESAVERALDCLSTMQDEAGGFTGWDTANSESTAQILLAFSELGIEITDSRFVKNGNTIIDALLSYYREGNGFSHAGGGGDNGMATEQAFLAIVGCQRRIENKSNLYDMRGEGGTDVSGLPSGLSDKHADVKAMPLTNPEKTFSDVFGNANQTAIETLAQHGIINGLTDTQFAPEATMTRAEFATIVVRGLGLAAKHNDAFSDVSADAWYAPYIGTAYDYGIIKGVSDTEFAPEATMTREEATVMVARVAGLCGIDTVLEPDTVKRILSAYEDGDTVEPWARGQVAFCAQSGILERSDTIAPGEAITRGEVAQMLYRTLVMAKLL